MNRYLALTTLSLIFLVSCGDDTHDHSPQETCDASVSLPGQGVFPEGIDADSAGSLYIGSIGTGTLYKASGCAAEARTFAQLPNEGFSVIGVLVDEENQILWACSSNFQTAMNPTVEGFSLSDGSHRVSHALEGGFGVCNDLAISDDNDLYVTESFTSSIHRIPAGELLQDGPTTHWMTPEEGVVEQGQIGLNGIVAHQDTLYVGVFATGSLLAIDIGTQESRTLTLDRPLVTPDGLERVGGDSLLVVEQASGQVVQISPESGALSPIATGLDAPTTVVESEGALWVVESQLDHLTGEDPSAPNEPFVVSPHSL